MKIKKSLFAKNISIQYPTIEIITALSWVYIYISSENLSNIIFSTIMISFLIPLAIIDLKHMFFPISLVLPLIVISSIFATIQYYYFERDINLKDKNYVGWREGDLWFDCESWENRTNKTGDIDTHPFKDGEKFRE